MIYNKLLNKPLLLLVIIIVVVFLRDSIKTIKQKKQMSILLIYLFLRLLSFFDLDEELKHLLTNAEQ